MGNIVGGAASGASMGSAFGPWGTAIGAVAGGAMGAFSGGGDEGGVEGPDTEALLRAAGISADAAKAAGLQNNLYLQKALIGTTQAYGNAKSDLLGGLNASKNQLAPYTYSGANAFDTLNQIAGLPTPQGGSFNLQQALQARSQIQNQQKATDTVGQAVEAFFQQMQERGPNYWFTDEQLKQIDPDYNANPQGLNTAPNYATKQIENAVAAQNPNVWANNQNYQANSALPSPGGVIKTPGQKSLGNYSTKQQQALTEALNGLRANVNNMSYADKLKYLQGRLGEMTNLINVGDESQYNNNNLIQTLQNALSTTQGLDIGNNPQLTPEQQKLLSSYDAGTLNSPAADPNSVLKQFFNTPDYQLRFGQGGASVDPNASVMQRFAASPDSYLLGQFDPNKSITENFKVSPGYQFQQDEGRKLLEQSAASRGLLESGAFSKDLTRFGQGLADQEFGSYSDKVGSTLGNYLTNLSGTFGNYQNLLSNIAGMGFNSNQQIANSALGVGSNLANVNMNLGNSQAGIYTNMGTNTADSILGAGAARSGGLVNQFNALDQRAAAQAAAQQAQSSQQSGMFGNLTSSLGQAFGNKYLSGSNQFGSSGGQVGSAAGSFLGSLRF